MHPYPNIGAALAQLSLCHEARNRLGTSRVQACLAMCQSRIWVTTPTAMSAYLSVTAAADFLPLRSFLACSLFDSFLSFTSSCTIPVCLFSA